MKRLWGADKSAIVENFVPEAGIEEVEHGMFGSTDIEIHPTALHPVLFGNWTPWGGGVGGIAKTKVVPAGASPLGHGVQFPG